MQRFLASLLSLAAMFVFVRTAEASTISSCTTSVSGSTSCTGTLDTPEDVFLKSFTVPGGSPLAVTVQTFGFGGGTNAAGTVISAGGFDPLIALFSSPPETILTAGGNPIASVPGSTQFFSGCPPAATVLIG